MCVVVCAEDCKRNRRIATYKTGACSLEGAKYIHDHKHFLLISPQRSNASPWLCVCVCLSLCGCVRVAPLSLHTCVYMYCTICIYTCVYLMCVCATDTRAAQLILHNVHTRAGQHGRLARDAQHRVLSVRNLRPGEEYTHVYLHGALRVVCGPLHEACTAQGYRNPNKPHLRPSPNERTCMGWHERHASLRWGSRGIYVPRR